jgi:DNA-nicking Smr family endonuclease
LGEVTSNYLDKFHPHMQNHKKTSDLILQHLDRYGIRDKDAIAQQQKKALGEKRPSAALQKRRGVVRKQLDLHGMTIDRALPVLRQAIDDCEKAGIGELLVIHGYGLHSSPAGEGVLKKAVLDFLEERHDRRIRDYSSAMSRDGGAGATLVRF